ncbi:Uncharacterized conserved protein, Ntn-hydrolase superfamily [Stigmatella aurantiaca]|uniref:Uncharacterized conserved protein, Ntn-hydrolase superfamily n=1 Tax=Stigmatella aurantiaca TaxID=41 RepID=A0A1H7XMT0_STIAU|nr:Uncharacterized conserved protein, Ntn-hydrolase superfamily [Stigmatella aurantiaca]
MTPESRCCLTLALLLSLASASAQEGEPVGALNRDVLGTRSIVACDVAAQACGVGVMSFPVTSSMVPYGKPGLALANQMMPSVELAESIISRIDAGQTPQQAINATLASPSANAAMRQIGVAILRDNTVQVGQYTGQDSWTQRCAVMGTTYAVQAAGQTSAAVCAAMAQGFQSARGSLAVRLMEALKAGARVGQDSRGERSGTVRVWAPASQTDGFTYYIADASVAGKRDALQLLESELYRYLGQMVRESPANRVELDPWTVMSLKWALWETRYYRGAFDPSWTSEAEAALMEFQAANSLFPRGTFKSGGKTYIDWALVQFILRAQEGSVQPAAR